MIEKMINQIKQYLPLKISEAIWDGTTLQMYGIVWNFVTLSAWRISTKNRMIFGCFDEDSKKLISCLNNIEILSIDFQNNLLKIDPIFKLSNSQNLEIFSTDTYEPWTFQVRPLGVFIATPSQPSAFDLSD